MKPQTIDQTSEVELLRNLRCASTLRRVQEELQSIAHSAPTDVGKKLVGIVREITSVLAENDAWERFERVFETIHGPFLTNLAREFPALTPTELRLAAFLKIPMPSKEVASVFQCSVRSIEKHRERMRKKFGLTPKDNLTTFLASRI